MLVQLRIRDLGVIDDAAFDLLPGLNVLTGETGAGKTMVVSGLWLLLGDRADSAMVRTGASAAVVEGLWDPPQEHPPVSASVRPAGRPTTNSSSCGPSRPPGAPGPCRWSRRSCRGAGGGR